MIVGILKINKLIDCYERDPQKRTMTVQLDDLGAVLFYRTFQGACVIHTKINKIQDSRLSLTLEHAKVIGRWRIKMDPKIFITPPCKYADRVPVYLCNRFPNHIAMCVCEPNGPYHLHR